MGWRRQIRRLGVSRRPSAPERTTPLGSVITSVAGIPAFLDEIFSSLGYLVNGSALAAGSATGAHGFQSILFNVAEILGNIGRGSSNISSGLSSDAAAA